MWQIGKSVQQPMRAIDNASAGRTLTLGGILIKIRLYQHEQTG
jgi:hypothetical protein